MTEKMIEEPMRSLMLTMSAWRRLRAKAVDLKDNKQVLGAIILYYMGEALDEASKELEQNEKKMKKQAKEAKE